MRAAPLFSALALLILAIQAAGAQGKPGSAPPRVTKDAIDAGGCARTPDEARAQVARLEQDWETAFYRRDSAFFERVLADDFVLAGGPTMAGKLEYIADVMSAPPAPPTVTGSPPPMDDIRAFGDVVVVSGVWADKRTPTMRFAITEIFACRGGRWMAVHGHYSALPAPDGADSVMLAARTAQRSGLGAEARTILERGAASASNADARLRYQLLVGNSYLYDGDVLAARRAYAAVAEAAETSGVASMVGPAHYGMALAEAFAGRAREAEAHLAESRRAGAWSPDGAAVVPSGGAAMLYALLGRVDSADAALRRAESGPESVQFVRAFRGLALAMAGRCADGLRTATEAPNQNGPVVVAVRARCAAAEGRRDEALAARDQILQVSPADPFLWSYHIARDVARQIR